MSHCCDAAVAADKYSFCGTWQKNLLASFNLCILQRPNGCFASLCFFIIIISGWEKTTRKTDMKVSVNALLHAHTSRLEHGDSVVTHGAQCLPPSWAHPLHAAGVDVLLLPVPTAALLVQC